MATDDSVARARAFAAGNYAAGSQIWQGTPGTPSVQAPTNPTAGTKTGKTRQQQNSDGSVTTFTEYNDGNGGTYEIANTVAATGATGAATGSTGAAGTSVTNAAQMLTAQFMSYGLTAEIAAGIVALKQGGLDDGTITSILQSPDPKSVLASMNLSAGQQTSAMSLVSAWNTRFSGNVLRQKAGLPALDAATYIATEDQYKLVMANAGLPAAAINSDTIGKIMAQDVSPAEVTKRINAATAVLNNEDPYVKQALQQQFGLTTGDMILHVLDPALAANTIQNKVTAAQIGGEALRQGLGTSTSYAEQLAAAGVTQSQAATGFQTIAQQLPGTQSLAARYQGYVAPTDVTTALEVQQFGATGGMTQAEADARLKRLQQQEVGTFAGSAGADTRAQSLGVANTQGSY